MTELRNSTIHEFIGLTTKIVQSTNKQIIGITGTIVYETKNMFQLKTKFGLKQIPKNNNIWEFPMNDNKMTVNGNLLAKRSYDRLEINL